MNRLRKKISLQFYILLAVVLTGAVVCHAMSTAFLRLYEKRYLDGMVSDIKDYGSRVSNQMQLSGYLVETNSAIDSELNSIGELLDGRIVIADNRLRVIYDTFEMEKDKVLISENAVRACQGETILKLDKQSQVAKLLLPLQATDTSEPQGIMVVLFSITRELEQLEQLHEWMFAICMLVLVVLLIISIPLSRLAVRPLKQVCASLRHVSDGFEKETLESKGYKEAQSLCDSANEMIRKNNKLEESRQVFVSNVSHELKTPMTSMKVLADALLADPNTPREMYQEFLTDIAKEITRENDIINDLLTLVKLDQNNTSYHMERTNINEELEDILHRVHPLAKQREIEILLESYREVYAEVDRMRFVMAITNLVENAIKYNKDFGYVHVTLNSDLRYCYITIEDSGCGIPEESLPYIFERFYRVDKARSRESGGTGLGLAIAKEIITGHKGHIRVYSREEEGSTFTVRLPLMQNSRKQEVSDEEDA